MTVPGHTAPAARFGAPTRGRRRAGVPVAALLIATLVAAVLSVTSRAVASELTIDDLLWTAGFAMFATVGTVIVRRRPGHRVGWVFLAVGVLGGIADAGTSYALLGAQRPLPLVGFSSWLGSWLWAPPLGGFVVGLMWFPNGHALNRWWDAVAWVSAGLTFLVGAIEAVAMWSVRGPLLALLGTDHDQVAHSWALTVVAAVFPLYMVTALVAMASQVSRYRRSTGIERQQLKWLAFYACIAFPALVLNDDRISSGAFHTVTQILSAPMWIAVAAGLAILRYRLYDIDRIISRTVSYAIVIAVLVGVYAAGVLGFGAVGRAVTGESGDLVVAVSTLLVAAAFRPVVTRVRALVDRRFNRAGVDAALAAEAFRARLRDEVELDTVLADLSTTVHRTLAPSLVAVMTLDGPAQPGDLA